jgi:FtsP/CotA-like multicopper oxidase with cupredoxin domain
MPNWNARWAAGFADFHGVQFMLNRRQMIVSGAAALATGALLHPVEPANADRIAETTTAPAAAYTPVITPNGATLPWKMVDGVKVFHVIAEPVQHEFAPGLIARCWGYNGRTPGPTIEAVEGDRCRFYVTNRLPEPTTVHWHGLRLVNGMDGVNGMTQPPIPSDSTFKYEFTLRQHGSFMYHPHADEMTQQGLGMMGMFIIHPRQITGPKIDRDFAIMLSEWRIDPGTSRPDPTEMTDFNILTMNSKVYPATQPLVCKLGDRVRIRFGNLSAMDHHPIHLHGFDPVLVEADGGTIPAAARHPGNTVLVPVGALRTWEFVADAPGDWPMHCHMTHHTMNQMGHGLPNMVGVRSRGIDRQVDALAPGYMTMGANGMGEMADMRMGAPANSIPMLGGKGRFGTIDMGGMFTTVKVRQGITSYDDPGDYEFPRGTVASAATKAELERDGIKT